MTGRGAGERRRAERNGRRAESLAALFLTLKGWRVLERRARTGAGEIDLVCLRGEVLAFVEVKARGGIEEARWSVSARQRSRLMRAGSAWRARHPRFARFQPRFDLVLLAPWRWPVHETGVFEAESAAERDML